MQWWLISEEDVELIRKGLILFQEEREVQRDALHALDSGLHITKAIPDDYADETEKETLNLFANDLCKIEQTRLKPYIVVTREWFQRLMSLFATLQLLADGGLCDEGKKVSMDLHVKKALKENCFDNWCNLMEPLSIPFREEK